MLSPAGRSLKLTAFSDRGHCCRTPAGHHLLQVRPGQTSSLTFGPHFFNLTGNRQTCRLVTRQVAVTLLQEGLCPHSKHCGVKASVVLCGYIYDCPKEHFTLQAQNNRKRWRLFLCSPDSTESPSQPHRWPGTRPITTHDFGSVSKAVIMIKFSRHLRRSYVKSNDNKTLRDPLTTGRRDTNDETFTE